MENEKKKKTIKKNKVSTSNLKQFNWVLIVFREYTRNIDRFVTCYYFAYPYDLNKHDAATEPWENEGLKIEQRFNISFFFNENV